MAVIKSFADSYQTPPGDPVPYRVRIRPPTDTHHWSLDNAFTRNGNTEKSAAAFRVALERALHEDQMGIGYLPQGHHMSGVITTESYFTRSILIASPDIRLFRATVACDGLPLPPHAGFILDPGGCAVLVLTALTQSGESVCIVAHAGLKSLVNVDSVHRHESVIDAMVTTAIAQHALPSRLTLRAFYPLPWEGLARWSKDPTWGERNTALLAFLREHHYDRAIRTHLGVEYIDLARLIHEQARAAGINTIDSASHILPVDGAYAYTTHTNPALAGLKRNLVTVVRLS